jgi:hypothetical protein
VLGNLARRRLGALSFEPLEFRVLWHRVAIEVGDADARDALRCLINHAGGQPAARLSMSYRLRRTADGYEILEEGDWLATETDVAGLLDRIYARIYRRALEYASLCGWVRLHAGLVTLEDGHRVLISGPTQAGKTTLIVRLLLDAVQVHGDEYVLVRDGQTIAVPRLMRLTPETVALMPELALARMLPLLPDASARMLDPLWVADSWSIDPAPADEIVLLSGRAAVPSLTPATASEVMPEIVTEALPNGEATATVLSEIARILRPTATSNPRCWRLVAGTPAETAELIRGPGGL